MPSIRHSLNLAFVALALASPAIAADQSITIDGNLSTDPEAIATFVTKFEGELHTLDITVEDASVELDVVTESPTNGLWQIETTRPNGAMFRLADASAHQNHASSFKFRRKSNGGGGGGGGGRKTYEAISQQIQIFASYPGEPEKEVPRPTQEGDEYYGIMMANQPDKPVRIRLVYHREENDDFASGAISLEVANGLKIINQPPGLGAAQIAAQLLPGSEVTFDVIHDSENVPALTTPLPITLSLTEQSGAIHEDEVKLLPVEAVSRDKYLAGSFSIPSDWDSLEMEFVGPSGENLGKYGNLLGGGSTKIFDRVEDILNPDVASSEQPANQKVWFIRNSTNSRKIDYYTCFNSVGEAQIKLYLNGSSTAIASIPHQLVAAADFGDWIAYVDNWVKGTSFGWARGSDPPVLAARSAESSLQLGAGAPGGELDNLTRACLIPIFTVVVQVEGLGAVGLGLLEGIKAGALDDWKLVTVIGGGFATAGNWAAGSATTELQKWISSPKHRAMQLKMAIDTMVEEYVFKPMRAAGGHLAEGFSSWVKFKDKSWAVWNRISGGSAKSWALTKNNASHIKDGILTWADDFNDRMQAGAEKVTWSASPWNGDPLLASLEGAGLDMAYRTGYIFGYLAEQIAVGKGIATVGKCLVRGAIRLGGTLAGRTTFAVGTRMHAIKKSMQAVAASSEIDRVVEKGLREATTLPITPNIRQVAAEGIEESVAALGDGRLVFGYSQLLDELANAPKLKQLLQQAETEGLFYQRFGITLKSLAGLSPDAARGFVRLYERRLFLDEGLNVEEYLITQWVSKLLAADAAEKTYLKLVLEDWTKATAEQPQRLFANLFPDEPLVARNSIPIELARGNNYSNDLIYTVLEDGMLFLGVDRVDIKHSYLAQGRLVKAAGTVKIRNGLVKPGSLDNASGHYRPSGPHQKEAAKSAFESHGFAPDEPVEVNFQ